ncbi:Uncharacterised protein [BD1-7 clade bacterium]|uniref:DUF4124 domain-containing protein n=1 Tax=BD1-7 clade bacterium TaxID=2029982 RepID=A0A5S9NLY9_9GAMM|nr:Uncharacterised protein [BD1-7 clade bacterium]CAA0093563.1 Uncharacterised protein [BD1-7 clade bacterium]
MPKRLMAGVFCVSALLISEASSAADVYQWRDAEGKLHFSDVKPRGVDAEKKTVSEPPKGYQVGSPELAEVYEQAELKKQETMLKKRDVEEGGTGAKTDDKKGKKNDDMPELPQ